MWAQGGFTCGSSSWGFRLCSKHSLNPPEIQTPKLPVPGILNSRQKMAAASNSSVTAPAEIYGPSTKRLGKGTWKAHRAQVAKACPHAYID